MDAKTKLKNGWIHVLVTFEVVGKPKEHVDETLKQLVGIVKKEERIEVIEEHYEEAIDAQEGMFSAFSEVDMLVKNIETLTWLASNFTPASVEVIEPLDFEFTAGDLQNWYNDVLHTMHSIGYAHKTQNAEMQFLKGQLRTLIENSLLISLARGDKNIEELSKDTSIDKKAVEAHLGSLEKEKKVKKSKGVYSLE